MNRNNIDVLIYACTVDQKRVDKISTYTYINNEI